MHGLELLHSKFKLQFNPLFDYNIVGFCQKYCILIWNMLDLVLIAIVEGHPLVFNCTFFVV